ncbi:hypothetical protein EV178_003372 [Coemansia sp. RSA 1646]|nr:hypothetical protein EV178_003372 [Coemansia sp. RSA 1646]
MNSRLVFPGRNVLLRYVLSQTKRDVHRVASKTANSPTREEETSNGENRPTRKEINRTANRSAKQKIREAASTQDIQDASNGKVMRMLETNMRSHNIGESWRWYQELVSRNEREPRMSAPPVPSAVVPRRVANSAEMRMIRAHTCMLDTLCVKHQFGYNKLELRQLGVMAREVLGGITRVGGTLSSTQANAIILLFTASGDAQAAHQVWQYAALSGLARDVTNYNSFIACLTAARQYDQAFALVQEMQSSGIQPNTLTQNLLIKLHGLTGNLQAAKDTFAFTCSFPGDLTKAATRYSDKKHSYWDDAVEDLCLCGGTVQTCNAMLDVLGMNGLVDEMHELLIRMCKLDTSAGVPGPDKITRMIQSGSFLLPRGPLAPNMDTFHTLIKWRSEYWDLDTAEQYVQLMDACGFAPVSKTFKLMITYKTVARDLQKCSELAFRMVSDYKIDPSPYLIKMLEWATEENDKMEESIRISEAQRPSSFLGFSLKSRSDSPPAS